MLLSFPGLGLLGKGIGLLGKGYNFIDRRLAGGALPGGAPRGGGASVPRMLPPPPGGGRLPVPYKGGGLAGKLSRIGGAVGGGILGGGAVQRWTGPPQTTPVVPVAPAGPLTQALPGSRQAILWIQQYPIRPRGYKPNKSSYYRTDPMTGQPVYIPARSVWVRERRRNPLNPRAARRAASRLDAAAIRIKEVFGSSYIIKRKPPRTTRRKK